MTLANGYVPTISNFGQIKSAALPERARALGGVLVDSGVDAVEDVLSKRKSTLDVVNKDTGLNIIGKGKKRQAIDDATEAAILKIAESRSNGIAAKRAELLANKPTFPGRPTDLLGELRQQEIRSQYRQYSNALDLAAAVQVLASRGDVETLSALIADPCNRLVPPNTVDGVIDTCLRAKFPDRYADADAYEAAVGLLRSNINGALASFGRSPRQKEIKQA